MLLKLILPEKMWKGFRLDYIGWVSNINSICQCGLARTYHDGRLKPPEEYRPRYTYIGDDYISMDVRSSLYAYYRIAEMRQKNGNNKNMR